MDTPQQRDGSVHSSQGSRPDEPRAHPRAMLTLAIIATVLAIASAPPRDAGAGTSAQTRVLATSVPSVWRVPLVDRLGSMAVLIDHAIRRVVTVSATWQVALSWNQLSERLLMLVGGLELGAAGTAQSVSAGHLTPTTSQQIARDAWVEYLALYQAGDPRADLTAPGGVFAEGYGCPDGSIDQADLLYRLEALAPAMSSRASDGP